MAKRSSSKRGSGRRAKRPLGREEIGAAFIAWYKDGIRAEAFRGGMITRAQAAKVLGISNMAVERLIGRGHVRARYFPREPDVEDLPVGADEPFWMRLVAVFGRTSEELKGAEWFSACYVSLDDVAQLAEKNDVKEKSSVNWRKVLGLEPMDGPVRYPGPHLERKSK